MNKMKSVKPEIVKEQKWYEKLIFDLRMLNFEGIVKTKHAIGKRILEDELKFERAKYGKKTIMNLADDLNTDKSDLYRCMEFAKKFPDLEEVKKLCTAQQLSWRYIYTKLLPEHSSVHFLSQTSEWTTPQLIIEKTIQLFGKIDLDPCSNPDFPNVPAKKYFTKQEDGLLKEWHGKIYMNPPYGQEIKKWINHLCEQFEKENTQEAIALTPSRTDTEWYQKMKTYRRCFIWGRLKFGDSGNPAPFPSMVVYLGENLKGFIRIFSDIGDIYGLLK